MSGRAGNTLPREVLRWLQSLDLAYSVKSPKRDFANGFLIAEIFSRYFDKDIQIHSFDNGTSVAVRTDNWSLLKRFFKKRRVRLADEPVSQKEIDAVIHCVDGAAVGFVNKVYEFLSGRRLQARPIPTEPTGTAPPFAKPTASAALRTTLTRDPELAVTDDGPTHERKMRETLEYHEDERQAMKAADPMRYMGVTEDGFGSTSGVMDTMGGRSKKVVRGTTRTVGEDAAPAQIQVKQVSMKPIEGDVARIRASKERHATRTFAGPGGSAGMALPGEGAVAGVDTLEPLGVAGMLRPALDVLNDTVMTRITSDAPDLLSTFDARGGAEPATIFVELALEEEEAGLPQAVAVAALQDVSDAAGALADSSVASPKEFWKVLDALAPLLDKAASGSDLHSAAADALAAVGRAIVARDQFAASSLMADFGLPRLAHVLIAHSKHRRVILRVFYAFYPADERSHTGALRSLQHALSDLPTFISCLAVLIQLETEFATKDLLDVYLYYCVMGLNMSAPALRASSVSMLSVVARHAPEQVVSMLGKLSLMQADTWWEVHAQLLVVCASLLSALSPAGAERQRATTLELVVSLLKPGAPVNVLRVGLAVLAPHTRNHPGLLVHYVTALLSLPQVVRRSITGLDAAPLPLAADGDYQLDTVPRAWSAVNIATQLARVVVDNKMEAMDVPHVELLQAVTHSPGAFASGMGSWLETFELLKDYVYVALCDQLCCVSAQSVLKRFLVASDLQERALEDACFMGALRMLYPADGGGDRTCQDSVAGWLVEVSELGDAFSTSLLAILDSFSKRHQAEFDGSALKDVYDRMRRSTRK